MKKQYIQPSMKAYKANTKAIICTSQTDVRYSGGNGDGGPTVAETKGYIDNGNWGEEWYVKSSEHNINEYLW